MQNWMLEFFLVIQLQVKPLEFLTKEPWLLRNPSMLFFYESNNSFKKRESFDDDLGLETSMGKLQIEDRM